MPVCYHSQYSTNVRVPHENKIPDRTRDTPVQAIGMRRSTARIRSSAPQLWKEGSLLAGIHTKETLGAPSLVSSLFVVTVEAPLILQAIPILPGN